MYRLDYIAEDALVKLTVNTGSSYESNWESETPGVEEFECSNLYYSFL